MGSSELLNTTLLPSFLLWESPHPLFPTSPLPLTYPQIHHHSPDPSWYSFFHPRCCTTAACPPPHPDRHMWTSPLWSCPSAMGLPAPRSPLGRGGVGQCRVQVWERLPSAFPPFPAHLCRCCSAGVCHCTRPPCCRRASWENRGDNSQPSGISSCWWPRAAPPPPTLHEQRHHAAPSGLLHPPLHP